MLVELRHASCEHVSGEQEMESRMMDDLSTMTLQQLQKLRAAIPQQIKVRLRSDFAEMAEKEGLRLEQVLPTPATSVREPVANRGAASGAAKKKGKKKTVGEIRYMNPADPKMGWTGKGRRPLWVEKWLSDGGQLTELAVNK